MHEIRSDARWTAYFLWPSCLSSPCCYCPLLLKSTPWLKICFHNVLQSFKAQIFESHPQKIFWYLYLKNPQTSVFPLQWKCVACGQGAFHKTHCQRTLGHSLLFLRGIWWMKNTDDIMFMCRHWEWGVVPFTKLYKTPAMTRVATEWDLVLWRAA